MKKKNKRYKKHTGTALMAAGMSLVLAAVCLMSYNFWDENRAEDAITEVLDALDAAAETETEVETGQSEPVGEEIIEPAPEPETDDMPAHAPDVPTRTLDSGIYIGFLEIPALGLRLPVMNDWSYPNLKISPCRYTGSVYENNMVVAAHNYSSHFGNLNQLQTGDSIRFIDMDENHYYYTVDETEIVMPTEIEQMITGDWDLTLFTCTIGGRTRVAVRCTMQDYE